MLCMKSLIGHTLLQPMHHQDVKANHLHIGKSWSLYSVLIQRENKHLNTNMAIRQCDMVITALPSVWQLVRQ